jgi:hypothetical protein
MAEKGSIDMMAEPKNEESASEPVKRPRGRPRKVKPMVELIPRRRGRPSKKEQEAGDRRTARLMEVRSTVEAVADASHNGADDGDSFFDQTPVFAHQDRSRLLEPNEKTLLALFKLGKLKCTVPEASAFLGVGMSTLEKFLQNFSEARSAWDEGQEHGKISLRRKQLQLADKNAAMAIFLGKNILGQKDEHHSNVNVTRTVKEMSDDELLNLARTGVSANAKRGGARASETEEGENKPPRLH